MKTTNLYDFTLTANGSQQIQADANFYKILTSLGDVSITRDGGSTVKPLRAGRGERNVPFLTLTLKDLSGAPNSGTILVGDSDFIDDTIVLSSALNVRPEPLSGSWADASATTANSPFTIFAPGANAAGAILLAAGMADSLGAACVQCFIAKSGVAPASIVDGRVLAISKGTSVPANALVSGELQNAVFIPAGQGLYFIAGASNAANAYTMRYASYKLL